MSRQEESFALPRVWSALLFLLIAVTYPLWVTPLGTDSLPAIPLVGHQIQTPIPSFVVVFLNVPSVVLLGGLLAIVIDPRRFQRLWWVVGGLLVCSFLIDQHRLQPWAYQSVLYAMVFAAYRPQPAIRVLIPLAASMYIYSGAGKIDYQFAHTVGQEFLGAIAAPLGGVPDQWSETARARVALVLPMTEILAGIGLLFSATRQPAGILLMSIHVTLLCILGPSMMGFAGLNHSKGVLVWNVLLIVQAYLLTKTSTFDPQESNTKTPNSRIHTTVNAIVLVAIVAPLFERSGYWDHWTSWALYAPHTSRVDVEVHQSQLDSLPASLATHVKKDTDGDGWRRLDMSQWSIHERYAPIYPQARYQLILALRLADQFALDEEIRATIRSASDRRTGRRVERRLLGRDELQSELRKFWLRR